MGSPRINPRFERLTDQPSLKMATPEPYTPCKATSLQAWRGFGEIWTQDTYHLCLRRSVHLAMEGDEIRILLPRNQIRFSPANLVEARTFRFPVPSMTVVFSHEQHHALVSLFFFPKRLQEQFFKDTGFGRSDRRTWRTGLEARRDQRVYGLQGSV